MAFFDMPLEKLQSYMPPSRPPKDFDAFWKRTLARTRACPLAPRFERVEDPVYHSVEAYDVTFGGYEGQPVKGWFIRPVNGRRPLPCMVTYIGYGGGRSLPVDHLTFAAAGVSQLVMDTRGQGSVWSPGDTPDPVGGGPQVGGFMTRGVESPDTYYYRRVFMDGARAVEAAAYAPGVDAGRIGVVGGSQGGGIALAVAGLLGSKVRVAVPDVPFLCNFRRATQIIDTMPYGEISQYLKTHRGRVEQTFRTLSYFDGMHFAPKIKARCLFSVGLMDTICPPSTVYAAYNVVKAPKEIRVYEFNSHEGGGAFQTLARLQFVVKHLA
jgi:cephalosporin-C deacetylase